MACKRGATSELNHDNWNREDEPEEAGTFSTASEEVLKTRIVRTAKRRLPPDEGGAKSAFGSFAGFKAVSSAKVSSPFSFLAETKKNKTTPDSVFAESTPACNGTKSSESGILGSSCSSTLNLKLSKNEKISPEKQTKIDSKMNDKNMFKQSSDYYAKLKGLNESVASWIKTHVDSNPFCLLTPIFKDYAKHLSAIEAQYGKNGSQSPENDKFEREHFKSKLESASLLTNSSKKLIELPLQPSNLSDTGKSEIIITQTSKSAVESNLDKSAVSSIFGHKNTSNPIKNALTEEESSKKLETKFISFPTTNTEKSIFNSKISNGTTSTGFSFDGAKPFSFNSSVIASRNSPNKESEVTDEDDEPPKPDFIPVTEDGAIFEQRCKLFVKKDGVYGDRGVGMLYLKPTSTGKTQLIVRADNALGNLLLNTLLTESVPMKRMNKNTVMLMCLPLPESPPPPTAVLLRVKTSEEADSLYEALDKSKK